MIDRDQALAAFAHLPLRRKQVFRSGFVCHTRVRGNIAHAINGSGRALFTADKSAAFVGIGLARVGDDLVNVSFCESYQSRSDGSGVLLVDDLQMQLFQLVRIDFAGCINHQVLR